MHDVVAAPVREQVAQHAGAEAQRRRDPPPPMDVKLHRRADRDHAHALDCRLLPGRPLAQREVGDLVPVAGQALGEVAVPALRSAYGVGEQAVVEEADPHGCGSIPDVIYTGSRDARRAFSVRSVLQLRNRP